MESFILEVVESLMYNGHLASLRGLIDRDMLPGLEKVCEDHALCLSTDEVLSGHIFIIYKRCIHL